MAEKMLHERLREWTYAAVDTGKFPAAIAAVSCGFKPYWRGEINLFRKMANEIEARYFPIPPDSDGDPLEIGRTYYGNNGKAWRVLSFRPGARYPIVAISTDGSKKRHLKSGWLSKESPAAEVLDADGIPIRKGDAVWRVEDGLGPFEVQDVGAEARTQACEVLLAMDGIRDYHYSRNELTHEKPAISADGVCLKPGMEVWVSMDHAADCGKLVYEEMEGKAALIGYEYGQAAKVRSIEDAGHVDLATDSLPWCPASWLVTTQPDTQERIEADALKSHIEYWGCTDMSCRACPAKIDDETPRERYHTAGCLTARTLDLLCRKHALDAAMMGGGK